MSWKSGGGNVCRIFNGPAHILKGKALTGLQLLLSQANQTSTKSQSSL